MTGQRGQRPRRQIPAQEWTPVLFRMFAPRDGGECIAIFPAEPGTNDQYTCNSYLHKGQHGACDPYSLMRITRRATPDEYHDLKTELESIGYQLRVIERLSNRFLFMRRDLLRALAA